MGVKDSMYSRSRHNPQRRADPGDIDPAFTDREAVAGMVLSSGGKRYPLRSDIHARMLP
jgi:hypothetical protein